MKKIIYIVFVALFFQIGHGTGFWEKVGEMPLPVYGARAVIHDSLIYVIGGYSSSQDTVLNTIQIFNPITKSWDIADSSLFIPRYGLNAHFYYDSLFVFGGAFDGSFLTFGLEMHDFLSDPVIYSYNYNFNRIYATSVLYKDYLYIFGGYPDYDLVSLDSPLQYLVKYNIPNATVEDSLPANRGYSDYLPSQQMSALVGDKVYLFGGEYNGILDDILQYDFGKDSIISVSKMYKERSCGAAVVLNSEQIIIIAGADGENRILRETEIYNVSENQVYSGPSLLKARSEITAVLYRDTVYVFGGKDSDGEAVSFVEKISLAQIYEFINPTTTDFDHNGLEQNRIGMSITLSNSPNPFNSATTIRFNLPVPGKVNVTIYSITGQKVRVLEDNIMEAGEHRYTWNGYSEQQHAVPSGLYFCRLTAGNQSVTHKIILVK
jgi:hypothetical protein